MLHREQERPNLGFGDTILITGLEDNILKFYLSWYKMSNPSWIPNPETLAFLNFLTFYSDVGQYYSMLNGLNIQ